jgi:hypothetical protein
MLDVGILACHYSSKRVAQSRINGSTSRQARCGSVGLASRYNKSRRGVVACEGGPLSKILAFNFASPAYGTYTHKQYP